MLDAWCTMKRTQLGGLGAIRSSTEKFYENLTVLVRAVTVVKRSRKNYNIQIILRNSQILANSLTSMPE